MKKCVIFGAGILGKRAWLKLKTLYEIVAYADNNSKLWHSEINGLPVISPDELKRRYGDMMVLICSDYYAEIAAQLQPMGIHDIRIMEPTGYMLYTYTANEIMMPVESFREPSLRSKSTENLLNSVLFVQQFPCIRTHKIASILKAKGIRVSLAYTAENPRREDAWFGDVYTQIYAMHSMRELIDFVNQSDFDVIHSSNEPDSLTNLLLLTNKKIIHDTHDLMSLCYSVNMDQLTLEYVANVKSHGNLYVNESNRQIALKKFKIPEGKTFVLENMVLESFQPSAHLPKLSALDGKIHCVYEGGIEPDRSFYRYFEDIWLKIVQAGIHIHFYSPHHAEYCKKLEQLHPSLHYEGCLATIDLIDQMTQYDCGLLLFNVTPSNREHLECATPNKMLEYVCAGLPVAAGEIESYKAFVRLHKIGDYLDLSGDIQTQLAEISKIQITADFLCKNEFTMDTKADELIRFYNEILQK